MGLSGLSGLVSERSTKGAKRQGQGSMIKAHLKKHQPTDLEVPREIS